MKDKKINSFNLGGIHVIRRCFDASNYLYDELKNDEVVEYSMSRTMSPMLVSEYKLQLPDKKILQKKLQELVNIPMIEE